MNYIFFVYSLLRTHLKLLNAITKIFSKLYFNSIKINENIEQLALMNWVMEKILTRISLKNCLLNMV
jgi:hypothetical protein